MKPLLLAALLFLVLGCGEQDTAGPCVGKIQKLYTEQEQPMMMHIGGDSNGNGGVLVPIGGGTRYLFYITREDSSTCSRHVSKKTWLNKREGDRYMYGAT